MSLIDSNNQILKGISGMVGKTVVFRNWRGRLVVANRPKPRSRTSNKQKVVISRFKEASQYSVAQMADPEAKALYTQGINFKKHSAYMVALADYLNAPIVEYVKTSEYHGEPGDTITIKAKDDFMVTRVKVEIMGADGVVLEQGDAVRYVRKLHIWKYQATVVNPGVKGTKISVTAFDRPGNKGLAEVTLL